jgi:hypothetical protein
MPDKIIEVQAELAEGFLGGVETNPAGAAIFPGGSADARDPGIRTVLFTDVVNSTTLTNRWVTKRRWRSLACTTRSCATRCLGQAAGK